MDELEIVQPKINNQIEINNLAKQVHKLHVNWNPDMFWDVEQVISVERLEKLLETESIYVAKVENKIVGYIIVDIKEKDGESIMRYRRMLHIDTLCIDENFRGMGIGTKMLEFAKKLAKEKNCTDMHLTVHPNNKNAIKVYENFGMEVNHISYIMKL
jgi:ribosomal protein S18 acetylase RimI-like enzyme